MDWDDVNTCMSCGSTDLSPAEDGFMYCNVCASQSQHYQEQCFDEEQRGAFNRTHVREYNVARNEALATQVQGQLEAIFGAELEDAPFATFLDDCGPDTVFGKQYPNFAHQVAYQYSKHLGSKFASYYLAAQIEAASKSGSQPGQDSQLGSQLAALAAPELRAQVESILFEKFSNSVRKTYIQGLQRILQVQCETLVDRFGVTPLICGICGSIWPRFLASTDVFDKDWAQEAMEAAEVTEKSKVVNHRRVKTAVQPEEPVGKEGLAEATSGNYLHDPLKIDSKSRKKIQAAVLNVEEPRTSFNVKATDVWLRALKIRVPVRITLAILYLACYVAREPILPTDITDWAYEGSLPYLAAFTELKNPLVRDGVVVVDSIQFPLDVKTMFQPKNVTGARNIEYLAGHIAQRIGLQMASVNFHGILCRFVSQLGLSVTRFALYGDRLYQWYAPPGLWLSAREDALPTRVYVMAMLVVILKIFYKLDGRKHLEQDAAQDHSGDTAIERDTEVRKHGDLQRTTLRLRPGSSANSTNLGHKGGTAGLKLDHGWPSRPLLDKMECLRRQVTTFGFERDLASYTKYCQEIIFPSADLRWDEEKVRKRLQRIFEKPSKQVYGSGNPDFVVKSTGSGKRRKLSMQPNSDGMESSATFHSRESRVEVDVGIAGKVLGTPQETPQEPVDEINLDVEWDIHESFLETKDVKHVNEWVHSHENSYDLVEEMHSLGFECLAPIARIPSSDGYTRYNFKKSKAGSCGVHEDYFIVLHVCSKILKVHPQTLHKAVQDVEKGLRQVELGVEAFLSTLQALDQERVHRG